MIEIDGSYLEGGGQILRTAVACAVISKTSCRVSNIRKKRCDPGLRPQHVASIKAVQKISNGKVENAHPGSEEITFFPGQVKKDKFNINIGTAGAITLILQTLMPIASLHKKQMEFNIIGGTSVKWSPHVEYFDHIFCDYMKKIGFNIQVKLLKHGFYPKGGGNIRVITQPADFKEFHITERGKIKQITALSVASQHLEKGRVAERQLKGFKLIFPEAKAKSEYMKTHSPGSYIHANAQFENACIGATTLGEKGRPAEEVGKQSALLLKKQMQGQAPFDEYMEDQMIPFMALSSMHNRRPNTIKVHHLTDHTKTNIWVVEKFLPVKFNIEKNIIECRAL